MEKIICGLFFVYLVLFPFGQLTQIPFLPTDFPEVHIYAGDIVVFLIAFVWGLNKILISRNLNKISKRMILTQPVIFFILSAVFSLLLAVPSLNLDEFFISGGYLFRWIIYAALYFVFKDLNVRGMVDYLVVIGTAVGVFGLIQYWRWPNLRGLEALGWDPHSFRVAGTFIDPGYTGIILVFTLLAILTREKIKTLGWQAILFQWFVVIINGLALALTMSRASWLALVAGMGAISLLKKSIFHLLTALIFVCAAIIMVPQPVGEGGKIFRTYTIAARIENWKETIGIIKNNLFFGVGFNTLRYTRRHFEVEQPHDWRQSHSGAGVDSSWLFVLTTTGILGFSLYVWIWFRQIRESFSSWNRWRRLNSLLILATLAALFTHSLFLNSQFYPWVMSWIWLLITTENK